jgi:phage terminase large subunit
LIYVNEQNKLSLAALHPNQRAFVKSQALNTAIIGGYQSGKSLAGVVKCITKLLQAPGVPIAYYLPTYGLIKDMLVPKFEQLFNNIGINYIYLKNDSKMRTRYGDIMMRSLDNPDRIVSYSVWYSLVDEFDLIPYDKMKKIAGRIASRNSYLVGPGITNSIDYVSTPEGFGYAHKYFVKGKNANRVMYNLSTYDNAMNLADSYIDGLRETYTEEQLKAYLDGQFVNLTSGTVMYKFNRVKNHSDRIIKPNDKLYVGMDFNIGKMAAIVHVKDYKIKTAVDEVIDAYDTEQMCEILKDRYPRHSIYVYPDASGSARKTSSYETDHEIIKSFGFKVKAPSKNPSVRNRVNITNGAFLNSKNETTYYVNTKTCPEYTEGLERLTNKNGAPDKSSELSHRVDAGSYFVWGDRHLNKTVRLYAR